MNTLFKPSNARIHRIREQGYFSYSDAEISNLAIGNRMAYQLCTVVLIVAVILQSPILVAALAAIAFISVLSPNHPFDAVYNKIIRHIINRPRLPRRSAQLTFACSIATVWLSVTSYLFFSGQMLAGNIMAVMFIGLATLLSTTDLCIPSKIYNHLFKISK